MLLVGCWSFTSLQHLRSYQDRYWLVTMHTHGVAPPLKSGTMTQYPTQSHNHDTELTSRCSIIVLPYWEYQTAGTHDSISHSVTLSWHWANRYLPYPSNATHQAGKRQVSIFISHWLDWTGNWTPNLLNARLTLYRFGHRTPCDVINFRPGFNVFSLF